MIYHDVEQGSSDWFDLRRGIPTASEFKHIITPAKGITRGPASKSYLARLIGEMMATFLPAGAPSYTSRAMDWGRQCEAEARRFYTAETGNIVVNGGFCQTDDKRFGASPDGLIGLEMLEVGWKVSGTLELKCLQPEAHTECVLDGNILPVDFRYQCHGHLLVTSASWCDFLSYCPGLPPVLVRATPDEYTEKLRTALEDFHGRLIEALAKVRAA